MSKGADAGTHFPCRLQRTVRKPTDELQGTSVRRRAHCLGLEAELRLSMYGKSDCDPLAKVVAVSRRRIKQVNGLVSQLIDCGGPIAFAVPAQLCERAVQSRRVSYVGTIVCECRLVYLLGGVPSS